jgi:serine protease inhibitor
MRNVLWIPLIAAGCSSETDIIAARQLPEGLRGDAAVVVQGNNQFAFDIYGQLAATPGNTFLSPFSISTAFAMVDAGAAGQTDAELRAALHFTLPGEQTHVAYGAVLDSLDVGRDFGNYTLATANRLFGQDGFPFAAPFLAITKDHYGAELLPVDFQHDLEGSRTQINDWVADQTEDKIPELFAPGALTVDTRLVLANAILFKGDWENKFEKGSTQDSPFTLADGSTVTAPIMSKEDGIAVAYVPGGRLGAFPFAGKDIAMMVLLPDEADGLPALEAQLSGATLAEWIAALPEGGGEKTTVRLPKFGFSSSFDLASALGALGITTAFDPATADLSGMDGARDLFLQTAVHKAIIAVDEDGAEAAAATGVGAGTTSIPETFEVDHPFVFFIYDNVTGSILFLGRVADPTK